MDSITEDYNTKLTMYYITDNIADYFYTLYNKEKHKQLYNELGSWWL